MTIAKTTARQQYAGNGSTTPFSFPYRFFADSDLEVYLLVDATDVETLQTLTTHYTVSNNGDETGGTVTMVTAPASGETLTILRSVPQTQSTDYASNDAFPAETHEAALDRLTLLVQQLQEKLDRALVTSVTENVGYELPADRASQFMAFNASGVPIAAAGTTGTSDIVVSTFMETVLDDTTAAAARTTLGTGTTAQGALADSALQNVVEDTTPQSGGPYSTNAHAFYESKGADVASATELLVLTDGNSFDVTGTTTITSIETSADAFGIGAVIKLQFDGAVLLTHHATNLILPSGANVTTAAGDVFEFTKYAAGDWRCTGYALASGKAIVETSESEPKIVAWVLMDGTGTPSITSDYNVASITDNGTGDYTLNFDSNLADANYAYSYSLGTGNTTITATTRAVGSFRFSVSQDGVGPIDDADISIIIVR